ncbi:hypothetical protein ACSBR1_001263 [Camellia fascicularis]
MASSPQGTQMQLQLQLIIMVLLKVVVVVELSSSTTETIAAPTEEDLKKLGCDNRCGNLNFSYPFGVKENCYRNENFFINCSDSQPYLGDSNVPVSNISLEEGELRIMNFISSDCYDWRLGTPLQSNVNASLTTGKFSISSTKNKFTAIGCDTYAYLQIYENNDFVSSTGCVSQCTSIFYVPNGTCSGIGCCQTSIPKGVGDFDIAAHSFYNHTNVSDFNLCSYAFVVEDAAFNFSTTYLQDFKGNRVPLVLDWGIGNNETCEGAKTNTTSYACGNFTACDDVEDVGGYICKCLSGYKGNPYLSDGCRDIDECADPNLNQCVEGSTCLNTPPGNYTCSCPKRYHGDGKIDGTRCTADPEFVLHIVIGMYIRPCESTIYSSF